MRFEENFHIDSGSEALSPDLEWMLQSGQVSSAVLVAALVNEYYAPLYRLALALLDDEEAAVYASCEAFIAARLNVYRYQNGYAGSGNQVHAWFYRHALVVLLRGRRQVKAQRALKASLPRLGQPASFGASLPATRQEAELWLAVDGLDEETRLLVLLRWVLDWPLTGMAEVVQRTEEQVTRRLEKARGYLRRPLRQAGYSAHDLTANRLDELLRQSLQARWPALELPLAELDQIAAEIESQASRRSAGRRRGISLREALLVGAAILLAGVFIWKGSLLFPEPAPPTAVVTRLVAVQPTAWVVTPTPAIVPGSIHTVRPNDSPEAIAARAGISVEELFRINRLPAGLPLREGQQLILAIHPTQDPAPILSQPEKPQPLSESFSSQEIRSRLSQSSRFWRTLWVDAEIRFYGPPGFIGPPQFLHVQAWSRDQNQGSLVLVGPAGDEPEEVLLDGIRSSFLAIPGENPAPFSLIRGERLTRRYLQVRQQIAPLNELGIPSKIYPGYSQMDFEVVGSDTLAGRETLIVIQVNAEEQLEAVLWLDRVTGAVLRKQQFAGGTARDTLRKQESTGATGQTMIWEYAVSALAYDQTFPPELFDVKLPWRGGFAADHTGRPVSGVVTRPGMTWQLLTGRALLPKASPPAGFDPARSRLAFQFSQDYGWFQEDTAHVFMDLFAEHYYLGKVEFTNPWNMMCARSPDGKQLAFAGSWPDRNWSTSPLMWFDLDHPNQVNHYFSDGNITAFAFAPDSRRLAAFRAGQPEGQLHILDTQTGKVAQLIELGSARNLAWSPDGENLALIGLPDALDFEEVLMVVHIADKKVSYRSPYDPGTGAIPETSPVDSWGVEFPVEMGGLERCVEPPTSTP